MKTALILGITGTFGGHVAAALQARGYSLRTLMRDPASLPARFQGVEVVQGDVSDPQALQQAAVGMDVMVYGVNPPGYRWKGRALPWLEGAISVAESRQMGFLFPGNVYLFDPADGPDFDEDSPRHPVSGKGRTRLAMEARLQAAAQRGARVIILRAGDFIAAGSASSWAQVMIQARGAGYRLLAPGPRRLQHSWAYVPDLAQSAADLLDRREQLPAFNVFHFRGYRMDLDGLAEAIRAASGRAVRFAAFPWWLARLAAPFSPLFAGLVEMRYLWRQEVNLDDAKLRALCPPRETPLAQALLDSGLVSAESTSGVVSAS